MKKSVLFIGILAVTVGCKKVADGGNLGRLKQEEGVMRYSDDEHRTIIKSVKDTVAKAPEVHNAADSSAAKSPVNSVTAPADGAEHTVNTMSAPVNNATSQH